jgi:predicted transcriptional regulator
MTDTEKYPSVVRIMVEGKSAGTFVLEDDPADHRGILSWFSQPQNRSLNEAGSYGYLIRASVPIELIRKATDKKLTIRFEVDESMPGGLAVFGERFGRYPVDPSVIFVMKQ